MQSRVGDFFLHFAQQNFLIRLRWRLFLTGSICLQAKRRRRLRPD